MFSFLKNNKPAKKNAFSEAIAIDWAKTENEKFFSLLSLRPEDLGVVGLGGIYVVWYTGLKTTTIYIGTTDDLGKAISLAKDNPDILSFHEKGSLGITWSPIQEKYRNNIASYLKKVMLPLLPSIPELDGNFTEESPIPVTIPFNV